MGRIHPFLFCHFKDMKLYTIIMYTKEKFNERGNL